MGIHIDLRAPELSNRDSPYPDRPFRIYAAITNKCNRFCPFCSVYASLKGSTFISLEEILQHVPARGPYEIQFEGGEPFLHANLANFCWYFANEERCKKIIISTNGTFFPFVNNDDHIDREASMILLNRFLSLFPTGMTFKVSINHHLLEQDPLLFEKCSVLLDLFLNDESEMIFNLRKRNDPAVNHDIELERLVDAFNLRAATNSFFLQRYGRNSTDLNATEPFIVGTRWTMLNPDGTAWGIDLIGRSEAMKRLA